MEVITTHINADFDCLGGMVAAQLLYPQAVLVFAGAQEPTLRDFLRSFPEHGLNFRRLKEIDLAAITRLILVDVNGRERIGRFAEVVDRPDVELYVYDHHPPPSDRRIPDLEVVELVGSTVTLMVAELQKKALTPDAGQATMMMLGLYEDTGSLLFATTTEADYRAAAYLLHHGADLNRIADTLNRELSAAQVDLLNQLLQSLEQISVHGVDVYLAQASVDRYVSDLALLAHKVRDMEHLDVLIIAVRLEDRIFLVGRSRRPEVDVGQLLSGFGGGGHATAASATVRDMTLIQVVASLSERLVQQVSPQWQAQHLMSSPVCRVDADQSLQQARELLTRYHINALAVVCREVLVGIITRQTIERAVHHGLAQAKTALYMSTEFGTVAPDSPLDVVQQLIVERRQRFVPVVEAGTLLGVITRADLLRHLVVGGVRLNSQPLRLAGGGEPRLNRRQVLRLIETRLPVAIRTLLENIAEVADTLGVRVYAVGGFVRDLLLDKKNLDIDIVVEGNAIAFAQHFAQKFHCRLRTHEKFITAVIIFADGFKLDVASTRTEYYLEPGALPLVEEASIKLDLYRRDFTINTLALALNRDCFGELLDYFGAQRDLRDKAIRVLHNLSFVEDPTRTFRAVRFEQRLGFKLGMPTERLLRSAVEMGFLERVSPLRLFNELVIVLGEEAPFAAVARLDELGLLGVLCHNCGVDLKMKAYFLQAEKAIHWYELLYVGQTLERWCVYFLGLGAALNHEQMESFCARLNLPRRWRQLLVEQRQRALPIYHDLERQHTALLRMANSRLYHILYGLRPELLLYFMAKTPHDTLRAALSRYVTQLSAEKTLLNGDDLSHMGVARGPEIREILTLLLDARLDAVVATRQDEENFVRNLLGEKNCV